LVLQIYDENGALVEEVSDLEFNENDFVTAPFTFMNEIYTQARRTAMGVEQALDSLLKDLDDY
jgi:hypothetical protein